MGTPGQVLDYQHFLVGILLRRFLSNLSASDYHDLTIALDEEISRLGPRVAPYIESAVFDANIGADLASGSLMLVDWYLETMAAKSTEWLSSLSATRVLRAYVLPNDAIRIKTLQFALLLEYAQDINTGSSAIVAEADRKTLVDEPSRTFTSDGEIFCIALIEKYLVDSPERQERVQRTLGAFALQVLRECLLDKARNMPDWVEKLVLQRLGEIGETRRNQVVFALSRRR